MRLSAATIIKVLLLALFVFVSVVSIYVLMVISDIPSHRLQSVSGISQAKNPNGPEIVLEKGSLVGAQDLSSLLLFSPNLLGSKRWIAEQVEKESLKKVMKGSHFEILETTKVPNFYKNDCEIIYCYQHRLGFENIPSIFWKGLMGIEDTRFLDHFGIDLKSILRAIVVDLIEMKMVQGASTVTQQLVRNLFYSNKKTITRKLKEIISSIYIEIKFPKENILEAYFNEVFWGALGGVRIKGIYSASTFYFGKKPSEIDPYEASILIGMLKGPNYYNPIRKLERLKQRTKVVFRKLVSMSLFPRDFVRPWDDKKWEEWSQGLKEKAESEKFYNVWRVSLAKKNLLSNFELFVFYQKVSKIRAFVKKRSGNKDFAIKAIMGEPLESQNNTAGGANLFTYYSKYERRKAEAIEKERHQIGSTIKPILYRLYLDHGKTLNEEIETSPIELELKSGKWSPRESHGGIPEKVTLSEALATSLNRPVIRLAQEMGFDNLEQKLKGHIPNLLTPLGQYPAQLLGAMELSVEELYRLYEDFVLKECRLFQEKEALESQLPPLPPGETRESTPGFDSVLELLSDPTITTVRKAVGQHMKNMRFFGKTGTSNNGYDSWFVFYEGRRLGVIWVGLEGSRKKNNEIRLYGSNTSFKIFEEFYRDRGQRFSEFSCQKIEK